MIRKVIAIALVAMMMLSCTVMAVAGTTTNSEDYIPSETIETVNLEPQIEYVEVPVEIEVPIELAGNLLIYIETDNRAELKELMAECEQRKIDAHDMAEAARQSNVFIVTGVRRKEEIKTFKKKFGAIAVNVKKAERKTTLTETQQEHESEVELEDYKFDFAIENKGPQQLKKQAEEFVNTFIWNKE